MISRIENSLVCSVIGVGVGVDAYSSTHPANIATATTAAIAIKPTMFFLFIFFSS
ncbi:MAG: hypothetical protein GH149_00640 [Methanosarcinales archaeon]|nr:hypothetical protein [Methanosarcinales archaeon]